MNKIIVTGCGTGVGKTIVSAIIANALKAHYWKPIECDAKQSDSKRMQKWLTAIHPPCYSFKAALSPHHAARLENEKISFENVTLPTTCGPLVIETVGGLLVPLNSDQLAIDLFTQWEAIWVVVSRHYIGSINHTLLTLEALKKRGIQAHLIFNGATNPDTEEAILRFSNFPCLGRLLPESFLSRKTLQKYGLQWQEKLSSLL